MGIKRIVDINFWNDDKVLEMFSPEDKLFMLYLLTNPHTTQLGIYAINIRHMAFELGYSVETIKILLERFENQYEILKYDYDTKELAIKNYLKHSIIKGGAPVRDCLIRELKRVKNKDLIVYAFGSIKDSELLNATVQSLIKEYEETNGEVMFTNTKEKSNKKENNNKNEKQNENENENDVSYHDTLNDTFGVDDFVGTYTRECFNLPQIRTLTDKRKKAVTSFKKTYKISDWEEVCKIANNTDFLIGKNNRGWRADFDFLINVNNATKVLEGKYTGSKIVQVQRNNTGNPFFDILEEEGIL